MTSLHYPSLELCKKLTEAGFPRTEYQYEQNNNKRSQAFWDIKFWNNWYSYTDNNWLLEAVCPSVMELLDVFPTEINWFALKIRQPRKYTVEYSCNSDKIFSSVWTLPNALAEMWLWLKENNYLTK